MDQTRRNMRRSGKQCNLRSLTRIVGNSDNIYLNICIRLFDRSFIRIFVFVSLTEATFVRMFVLLGLTIQIFIKLYGIFACLTRALFIRIFVFADQSRAAT